MHQLFDLTGQVALVTGVSRASARPSRRGWRRPGPPSSGRAAAPERDGPPVPATGSRFHGVAADLSRPRTAEQVVRGGPAAHRLHRHPRQQRRDHPPRRRCWTSPSTDWDDVLDDQPGRRLPPVAGRRPAMVAQGGGKIINIASMLSFQGGIRVAAYTASKHAVAGLTKALANEWAAHGINVNAIAPGYMATDNTAQLRADDRPQPGRSWTASPPAAGAARPTSRRGRVPRLARLRLRPRRRSSPSTAAGWPAEAWGWPRAGPLPPGRACAGPASTSLDRIGIEGVPDGIPHKVEGEHGGHDEEPRRRSHG